MSKPTLQQVQLYFDKLTKMDKAIKKQAKKITLENRKLSNLKAQRTRIVNNDPRQLSIF